MKKELILLNEAHEMQRGVNAELRMFTDAAFSVLFHFQ